MKTGASKPRFSASIFNASHCLRVPLQRSPAHQGEERVSSWGQNAILKKYGLKPLDAFTPLRVEETISKSLESARKKLILIESHNAKRYFHQIFSLFPESIRPEGRTGFKAYDGLNNVFNFGYYVLKCRIHKALLKAKLEPYLGFLHSVQYGKPSLVCDFQELYRYLIDDFVSQYCQGLAKRDFTFKTERISAQKKGKREYLNDIETRDFTAKLNNYFETTTQTL
jgi:CRISPR-associated endonuclease Cas1